MAIGEFGRANILLACDGSQPRQKKIQFVRVGKLSLKEAMLRDLRARRDRRPTERRNRAFFDHLGLPAN